MLYQELLGLKNEFTARSPIKLMITNTNFHMPIISYYKEKLRNQFHLHLQQQQPMKKFTLYLKTYKTMKKDNEKM